MSQENVEVIRGVHEHLHRTGEQPREAYAEDLTGDASRLPGFGVYRSREEVISAWLAYRDTFDEWWLEVKEVLDGQGDRVFVATRDGGQMKASGSEVHNDFFNVYELRDGKIVAWTVFLDRTQALEAAGLRE
jgi:limonene-1,2-epoxide hydrolase